MESIKFSKLRLKILKKSKINKLNVYMIQTEELESNNIPAANK